MKKNWDAIYFDLKENVGSVNFVWGMMELGIEPAVSPFSVPDAEYTEEELRQVLAALGEHELAVSQDFSAVLAEACHRKNRIYISWVYDSPQRALYLREALYDTNMIFVFDKMQLERMKAVGLPHVFHHPLAANVTHSSLINVSPEALAPYQGDISFVGKLYYSEARKNYFRKLSEETRAELERILAAKVGNWHTGSSVIGRVREEYIPELMQHINGGGREDYSITEDYLTEILVLAREAAYRERILVLNHLAEAHRVTLYTEMDKACEELQDVAIRGRVKYDSEMLQVFAASKINLNLTMASIENGVPLRVFDIMSIGGFVLSNYQEEMEELFDLGKEIVTFKDLEECADLADYYLRHDRERLMIALAGYKRVSRDYNCCTMVKTMLDKTAELFGG